MRGGKGGIWGVPVPLKGERNPTEASVATVGTKQLYCWIFFILQALSGWMETRGQLKVSLEVF